MDSGKQHAFGKMLTLAKLCKEHKMGATVTMGTDLSLYKKNELVVK